MHKCTPDHQLEQIRETHRIIPAIKGWGFASHSTCQRCTCSSVAVWGQTSKSQGLCPENLPGIPWCAFVGKPELSWPGVNDSSSHSHNVELNNKEESGNTAKAAACLKQVGKDTKHTFFFLFVPFTSESFYLSWQPNLNTEWGSLTRYVIKFKK